MLKLKKYFKKYWLLFVLAIVCIFGQAYTELTLPDYMSDIVSSGIQAGGFDSARKTGTEKRPCSSQFHRYYKIRIDGTDPQKSV